MRSKKRTVVILIASILCLLLGFIFARLYYIKLENDKIQLMFSDNCLKDNMGRVEPDEKYYEIMNSILGEDRQIGTLEDNICHYAAEKDNYAYDKETGTGYIDNEILIYAKDGINRDNIENLAQRYNAEIVGHIKTINYYQWKFNTNYNLLKLKEICNKLEHESIVEHATINYIYKTSSSGVNYGEQWKQENWSETNISGSNWGLEAIKAISAWGYMEQMNPVRIGLMDSGFDANTGVETDKEFQNLIEQEKIQGTGHEDLEFSATYCNVPPAFLNAGSHGTHVAGIMAANSDNSEGICGTYPYGKNNLYGVNVIGSAVIEETTLGQYNICFAFLIENNVKVINSSVISAGCGNWFLQSEIYEDKDSKNEIKKLSVEIATLLKKYIDDDYDFVIVQAAGNESNCQYTRLKCSDDGNISYNKKGNCKYDEHGTIVELDSSNFKIKNGFWKREFYYIDSNGIEHEIINMNNDKIIQSEFLESKYSSSISAIDKDEFKDVYDRIIVVGAVGLSKNESTNATFYHIWEHSNLGERIDVVAPGDNIYSTIIGGYDYYSGTSMAAPYVSGTAAMVWSANNDLTGAQVKEIICNTANQRITSTNANSEFSKLPDNVIWYKMINAKLAVEEAVKRKDTENQSSEPVEIEEIESTETTTITKIETTTTTTESTQTIPEEASIYNGHFYMVYPESMTWLEAKEYCENLGGHLVTISDADEQKFIDDLAEKYTDKVSYWLGGYYSDAEWKWVDDTEFSYTNWDSWTDGEKEYRQPDNFTGDEFYLRFANQKMQYENWYSNKGKWNYIANEADGTSGDVPLDSFGLICEWDNVSQDNTTETEATANIVDSGTCGDNLTWTLDTNGQLTIEGKGEMYNYYTPYNKSADSPPWRYQKIKSVVIKSGVTSIGNGAFGWQDDLGNVSIADTVTSIGVYSFFSCDSLVYLDSVYQIPEKITSIGKGAFDLCCNMRCVYVGKNVTKLDDYSLDPTYIGTIYGYEGSEAQAYAGRNGISFVCVDDDYGYHGTISNQNGASFRSGSSEKSKEISVIPYGTEVSEYDSTGDWALIKYKGTLGYVYKDDLLFEGGFAKPVIYLYPEKKQDVSVKVNFKNGDFICTYPEYNNGWNVTAYPNGRIINKSDNDEYSYLYWEGEGAIQYDFSSGFVVKREDTAEFLKEKLSYMGLSPKEYNEFIVYWLPIMQKNKYNLISFQMENYEESAQLEVSPKPDSMLRVFMAFQEADADTKVPEQQLKPFQREGFTVIEWGGTEVQ